MNLREVDQVLDDNMKNLVRQMLCEIKREAFEKVYEKENFLEEEDEEGNLWPKVEELIAVKPKDFATEAAWRALCMYWSTPSFRKMSMRGKENRLAGGNTVYHRSGSRGLVGTQQFLVSFLLSLNLYGSLSTLLSHFSE